MDIYQIATAFWDQASDQEKRQETIQMNLTETEKAPDGLSVISGVTSGPSQSKSE